jgi:hypothetical protein
MRRNWDLKRLSLPGIIAQIAASDNPGYIPTVGSGIPVVWKASAIQGVL